MPVLYLIEQGATLHKQGDLFLITKQGKVLDKVPAIKVEQVVVFGNVNLTTPVIHYLLEQGIDCVFCSSYGKYHGRLFSTESKFGLLRRQQLEMVNNPTKRLAIAKKMVRGKLLNQRTLLMRYRRQTNLTELDHLTGEVKHCLQKIDEVEALTALQGLEGHASALYYRAFKNLLRQDFGFVARVRRPPTDPVNSMLSFGYTLLVYNVQAAVRIAGLDPFLGFLHATEYSRPSLVLDLMEEFRPIIVDSVVLRLINTQVITETDFKHPEEPGKMVLLTDGAIRKFLHQYEERVSSQIFHPNAGQVTYRRCFELQARQLVRVITGREAEYTPFVVK